MGFKLQCFSIQQKDQLLYFHCVLIDSSVEMAGSLAQLIDVDGEWIAQAPSNFSMDIELDLRLRNAYAYKDKSYNENGKLALRNLRKFGLIVENTESAQTGPNSTPIDIAHNIAATLLNYSCINQKPDRYKFNFMLDIQPLPDDAPEPIAVPTSSKLILLFLSQRLNINIFLFSSKSKAHLYKVKNAVASIGFFHWVDSIYGTSTFLVLAKTRLFPLVRTTDDTPPDYEGEYPKPIFRNTARGQSTGRPRYETVNLEACLDAIEEAW